MTGDARIDAEREGIEQALTPPPTIPESSVVTGFVIISEWMDPEGERHLCRLDSEGATEWWRYGLLSYGLEDGYWTREGDDD